MKKFIKILLLICLIYGIYSGYTVWTFGEEQEIPKADAAIVLGAAQWNGKPSPVFEGRLKQGIELYKDGVVDYLIFTGGMSENAVSSEAEVGRIYAIEKGVPKEDIFYEDRSQVTEENLINAKEVTTQQGIDSYLIVSDRFHLKRAVAMAENQGMNVQGVPTKYSAYQSLETKLPFFFKEWAYCMGHHAAKLMIL
ncbi:YdcF family protein [Halobacillus litoralis]|uniref:YdcF family protein n=1 Tax=Halobacillus litoralis TaxID=45668 RepID=UPI001CFF2D1A|nr:YdcF family protein [Halobacillus litoralis]